MLELILCFLIKCKFFVMVMVLVVLGLGIWNFIKLLIDVVFDIINV